VYGTSVEGERDNDLKPLFETSKSKVAEPKINISNIYARH